MRFHSLVILYAARLYEVEFTFYCFVKKRFINSSVCSQAKRDFLFVPFNLPDSDIKNPFIVDSKEDLIGRWIQRNSIARITSE